MAAALRMIDDESLWTGPELEQRSGWRFALTPAEVEELEAALAAATARGLDWTEMRRDDFPLPLLSCKLARIAAELETGSGLAVLSGLPVARHDEAALRILWYGLGLNLGQPRFQDCHGLLMRGIRDDRQDTDELLGHRLTALDGSAFRSSKARTLSSGELRFHTDRCDVVGLLCVRQAADGGISRVASTAAVHNEILRRAPELLAELYKPYHRSRLGEEADGARQVYALPVFGVRDGRLTSHYSRTYIEAAQELPEVPRLGAAQRAAIDLLHPVADELCVEMRLRPGEVQFLNSHATYHARTAFTDPPPPAPGRLLLRLWLAMPNSRALPADHAVLWGATAAGVPRGGIGQAVPA